MKSKEFELYTDYLIAQAAATGLAEVLSSDQP
jgi:hypothetical protein